LAVNFLDNIAIFCLSECPSSIINSVMKNLLCRNYLSHQTATKNYINNLTSSLNDVNTIL